MPNKSPIHWLNRDPTSPSRRLFMIRYRLFALLTIVGVTVPALHAAKFDEMDYGRFISHTFNNTEGKNTMEGKGCAVNKGIAIKLGKDEGALLFDTDLCRF